MTPQLRLKVLREEARALLVKADNDGLTDADNARAIEITKEIRQIEKQQTAMQEAAEGLRAMSDGRLQSNYAGNFEDDDGPSMFTSARRGTGQAGQAWGLTKKAEHYTRGIMGAFKDAAPLIGGPYVSKQLVPSGGVSAPFDGRILEDPRQRFSLPAALAAREVEGPSGTYLRQTLRDNQAASVITGGHKPISKYGLEPAEWKIATIAHLSEPIAIQWLADYEGLQQFLTQELAYGVDEAVSDFILFGGTAEDGTTITGMMNTTGVLQTAFQTSPLRTIRAGIGELEAIGVEPNTVVMAPVDWEAIEVSLDGDGNYMLPNAPVDRVNQRLWGLPVITPPNMPAGEAIVGDLSTVTLVHRSSHQLTWSEAAANTGTDPDLNAEWVDLYRTNQVRFRDEVRVGLEISSLKTYRVASLTA